MEITICITTFKKRLNLVKDMIDSIKRYYPEVQILLAINGEHEEKIDEDYRGEILRFISSKTKVIPIMYTEFRSLSKLWNNLVIFSNTNYNLLMNDDLLFESNNILENIINFIKNTNSEFFTINNTFSHFVITKTELDKLGYFDERFLAHGEEDGDMVWRYINEYNSNLPVLSLGGIKNVGSYQEQTTNMTSHSLNKPKFNRTFCFTKYQESENGIVGMFGKPYKKIIENEKQYPYEMFWMRNKKYISEGIKFEM